MPDWRSLRRYRGYDPLVESAAQLIQERENPLSIIVFGSRARGTEGERSDLDLLVVLPEGIDRREAMMRISSQLPLFEVDVDVLVATPSVLRQHGDNPGLIYHQILREGRAVHPADARA